MTDGYLPGALTKLHDAVSGLIDPRPEIIDGKTRYTDSWYRQLKDSLPGNQGNERGSSAPLPGCWLDALDLIIQIDDDVSRWQPAGLDTPERLGLLEARPWRPQDVRQLGDLAGIIGEWAEDIRELLRGSAHWTLPNPCPACGTQTVMRRDSGGDLVRQPALQIGGGGCTCQHCRAAWDPNQFVWLARLLGYDLPPGVLE